MSVYFNSIIELKWNLLEKEGKALTENLLFFLKDIPSYLIDY